MAAILNAFLLILWDSVDCVTSTLQYLVFDYYSIFYFQYSTNYTLVFTTKLVACLSFLIFIRGGVPRYRYDFLTKIGWVKFLGYVLSIFLVSILMFVVW